MTVESVATELGLWRDIRQAIYTALGEEGDRLLRQLASLPIKSSRATRRLGSYNSRHGVPLCIRLQFAQEPENLKETLLHEIAHFCDHQTRPSGKRRYPVHGERWQAWAEALGVSGKRSGNSEALNRLYRQRLKRVAICQKCGVEFHRLKRLSRRRTYVHPDCGGILKQI